MSAILSTEEISALADRLVRTAQPQQVIMFGSYAKGRATINSDLDVLLVVPDHMAGRHRPTDLTPYVAGWIRIDLHIVTTSEFEVYSREPYHFLYSIRQSGKVLYASPTQQTNHAHSATPRMHPPPARTTISSDDRPALMVQPQMKGETVSIDTGVTSQGVAQGDGDPPPDKVGAKGQLITLIGAAVIILFIVVWVWVLILVWTGQPPKGESTIPLGSALVLAAGTLTTTVGTLTASALGFTIADVKKTEGVDVTVASVGKTITAPTAWAVVAYLLVGIAVLITWIAREPVAPELIVTFGFSILGWLVGGAGAAFSDPTPSS